MPKRQHKMVVCIQSEGRVNPSIEYINFDSEDTLEDLKRYGEAMKKDYDEVYIVNFYPFMADLIKEIRRHGKKL